MNVSCDACKLRKVKCDRKEKLDRKRQTYGNDGFSIDEITCTGCDSHGLVCGLTKKVPKARMGSRLRQLHKASSASSSVEQRGSSNAASSSAGNQFTVNSTSSSALANPNPYGISKLMATSIEDDQAVEWLNNNNSTAPPILQEPSFAITDWGLTSVKSTGLFGVHGLTRHLLDACLQAYFLWLGPTTNCIRGDEFTERYKAFFDIYNGATPPSVRPASEAYLLAFAATGAGLLESNVPSIEGGKFALQDRLVKAFLIRLHEKKWSQRSDEDTLEMLQACYSLSFLACEDGSYNTDDLVTSLDATPLSDGTLASMALKLKLNRCPRLEPRAPKDGNQWRTGRGEKLVSTTEAMARKRTFLMLYYNDGYRSIAVRRPLTLTNDCHDFRPSDYGVPPYDPGFHPYTLLPPQSHDAQESAQRFAKALHAGAYRLGDIVRRRGPVFVSLRSQSLGVPTREAAQTISELTAYYAERPDELHLESQWPKDWRRGQIARPTGYTMSHLIRSLFFEVLYHGQIMATLTALEDFGQDEDGTRSTFEATQLLSRLTSLAWKSLRIVADLCRKAGSLGVLRAHPVVSRHLSAGYAMWACTQILKGSSSDQPLDPYGARPSDQEILHLVEEITFGISTCDSARGTPAMVKALQDLTVKARAVSKDGPRLAENNGSMMATMTDPAFPPFLNSLDQLLVSETGAPPSEPSAQDKIQRGATAAGSDSQSHFEWLPSPSEDGATSSSSASGSHRPSLTSEGTNSVFELLSSGSSPSRPDPAFDQNLLDFLMASASATRASNPSNEVTASDTVDKPASDLFAGFFPLGQQQQFQF